MAQLWCHQKESASTFCGTTMPRMEAPKTPPKRGRRPLPPGEKLKRGTLYLPPEAWAKIAQAGRPALIAYLQCWRIKLPAG